MLGKELLNIISYHLKSPFHGFVVILTQDWIILGCHFLKQTRMVRMVNICAGIWTLERQMLINEQCDRKITILQCDKCSWFKRCRSPYLVKQVINIIKIGLLMWILRLIIYHYILKTHSEFCLNLYWYLVCPFLLVISLNL